MKTGFICCFTDSLYIMAERKSYKHFERGSYQDFERESYQDFERESHHDFDRESYEGSEETDYLINSERKEESRLKSKKICLGKGSRKRKC